MTSNEALNVEEAISFSNELSLSNGDPFVAGHPDCVTLYLI